MRGEQPQRSTTQPRHIEASERAIVALSLRSRGHSYRAIASKLGLASRQPMDTSRMPWQSFGRRLPKRHRGCATSKRRS